ncbi:hypothetical protein SADUNF_Sadunf13G0068400 [Salix dunnii]|uniref:Uncharacterized protein n=1 Tax=Salix dunnii TaxID=1413687 RepID=A0A835MKZ2_9ROSI|nr:hypothetical protein SADUNF_Sadunf13G0068400 [Salix dunnii]
MRSLVLCEVMMKMPDKQTKGSYQQADNLICDDVGTNCLATSASVNHVVEFTIPEEDYNLEFTFYDQPLILTEQLHANDVPRTSSAQEDPFNGLESLWD